jgi:serine/threonine-protein kinase RsbW
MAPPRAARFTMTSEPEQLPAMRSWLRAVLMEHGLTPGDCWSLLLAVGELCTNSIKHAYGGAPGHPIRISVQPHPDRVVIDVEDFGTAFDGERYVAPDLNAIPDHGLGLYVVRNIVDHLAHVARDQGTCWTIEKYRPRPGSVADAAS